MEPDLYGVLWDMDGVLVDTGDLHYQAWSAVLPEFGLSMSREQFYASFGMNNASITEMILGRKPEPEFVERLSSRKEILFRELIRGHVQPLPGVRDWVERFAAGLDGARFVQAVASSAPPENIELMVTELGLRDYFEHLVDAYTIPGKPDPAVFIEASRRLGLPRERCLIIEDSLQGLEAARRARIRCVAVATTNPPQALQAADLVVESLEALTPEAVLGLLHR